MLIVYGHRLLFVGGVVITRQIASDYIVTNLVPVIFSLSSMSRVDLLTHALRCRVGRQRQQDLMTTFTNLRASPMADR